MDDMFSEQLLDDLQVKEIAEGEELAKSISPTFCAAKWFDLQVKLNIGVSHSCCKVPRGELSFSEELEQANLDVNENLDLFNNFPSRLAERQAMLRGEQLKSCNYCWKVENQGKFHSYRRFHNRWELEALRDLALKGHVGVEPNAKPAVLELAFSNTCTFKCLYCGVENSSAIEAEFYRHGPVLEREGWQTRFRDDKVILLKPDGANKLEDAFWKWWDTIFDDLRVLKLTGGEPLLEKRVWRLLESLRQRKNPKLMVTVITNLSSNEDATVVKLADTLNELIKSGAIKSASINCSLDGVDERTEYVRNGLNLSEFLRKYELLVNRLCAGVIVAILPSFCLLTILGAPKLLGWFVDFRQRFQGSCKLTIGANYVLGPPYLSLANLTDELKEQVRRELGACVKELCSQGLLTSYEVSFYQQIFSVLDRPTNPAEQANLRVVLAEIDRRRGTDRFKTFPELVELLA